VSIAELSDGRHHPRRDRGADQNAEREHGNGDGYSHRPAERPKLAVVVSGHGMLPAAPGGSKYDNCGCGTVGADVPASAVTARSSRCYCDSVAGAVDSDSLGWKLQDTYAQDVVAWVRPKEQAGSVGFGR
jgi:hypothetical protein